MSPARTLTRPATRRTLLGLAAGVLLAGCALPPRRPEPPLPGGYWSGRLALQVPDAPQQSFSASFELRGAAEAGELSLLTPVGTLAALLRWSTEGATLQAPGQPDRRFTSLSALVQEATGAALPVGPLFDWLAGIPTPVEGWQPDLSQQPFGRLRARRLPPAPAADLRVVLDPS